MIAQIAAAAPTSCSVSPPPSTWSPFRKSAYQMSVEAHLAKRNIFDQAALTSDPSLRGVFDEDAVSISGDIIAAAGLGLSQAARSQITQAIAAILIGLVLIRIGLRLIRRNRDFVLGQPIPATDRDRVGTFVLGYRAVTTVGE